MKRKKTARLTSPLTLILLGSVVLLFLAGAGFRLYQLYNQRSWNYRGNFIVLDTQKLELKVYLFHRSDILAYQLPQDVYAEIPGGYGTYKLSNVKELAQTVSDGNTLIAASVSRTFGIPIDAVFSQLYPFDRLYLWYRDHTVEETQNPKVLSDKYIYREKERADGSTIETVDQNRADNYFADTLWEEGIVNEGLTVGVFNASTTPAVAKNASQILERIGFHIIDLSNWDKEAPEMCELRVKEARLLSSVSVERINSIFHCTVSEIASRERFDIQLIFAKEPQL